MTDKRTIASIANKFGVQPVTVQNWLRNGATVINTGNGVRLQFTFDPSDYMAPFDEDDVYKEPN